MADSVSPARLRLRLYVAGPAQRSQSAIRHARALCDVQLRGRCDLEVVDIYQEPWCVRDDGILAVPTLVRLEPLPMRRFVGDLSQTQRLLEGLDLEPLP